MTALAELVARTRGWRPDHDFGWLDDSNEWHVGPEYGWPLAGELIEEMQRAFEEVGEHASIELTLERGRWNLGLWRHIEARRARALIEMGDTHPDPPTAVALCYLRWRGVDEAKISAAMEES